MLTWFGHICVPVCAQARPYLEAKDSTVCVLVQDLQALAEATGGMSARDLRAVCEVAERRWVAAIIREREAAGTLPPLTRYLQSAEARRASLQGTGGARAAALAAEQMRAAMAHVEQLYARPESTQE